MVSASPVAQPTLPLGVVPNLVRYDALFRLLDEIQHLQSAEEVIRRVATQWKYFAAVTAWRLVLPLPEGFCVIDGRDGEAEMTQQRQPHPWDAWHLADRLPRRVALDDPALAPAPPPHLRDSGLSEIQILPVLRLGQCVGLLSAATRARRFAEADLKFIRTFGNCLTDLLNAIRLRQQTMQSLQERATRDTLTGLLNRGAILEHLDNRLSPEAGAGLGVVLADIDGFKAVNDLHGHLSGDRVLAEVAERLQALVPEPDALGRFGGEEFLVVLFPCSHSQLTERAEALRRAVADLPAGRDCQPPLSLPVTISLGTAYLPAGAQLGAEELVRRADAALYRAKNAGRNRVVAG